MPEPARTYRQGEGLGCGLREGGPQQGAARPPGLPSLPSPPAGTERRMRHSLFARTETREHISIGGKLYFFLW